MVRRGSTVRVRQRALKRPANGLFCCLGGDTTNSRPVPKSSPQFSRPRTFWLVQRTRRSQSPSVLRRGSAVAGRGSAVAGRQARRSACNNEDKTTLDRQLLSASVRDRFLRLPGKVRTD